VSPPQRGVLRFSDIANLAGAITAGRLLIAVIFPFLIHDLTLALAAYLLAIVSDVADGTVARWTHTESHTGAVADGWVDKILHINGAWAMVVHDLMPAWWMWLWFTREIVQWIMLPALLADFRQGHVRTYTTNLAGRVTAVLLCAAFTLTLLGQTAAAEVLTWAVGIAGSAAAARYLSRALDDRSKLR